MNSNKMTLTVVVVNLVLFILKMIAGTITGSLSIISDALNSFVDIISSTATYFAVKVSNKEPDLSHPFGHHRAEPLAGFVTAVFTGILGFEIIKSSIESLINNTQYTFTYFGVAVLAVTIVTKGIISFIFLRYGKKNNRPAIKAIGIDGRNDVFISILALIGFSFPQISFLDEVCALFIGIFILYSGYEISKENIMYLMGNSAPLPVIEKIRKIALDVNGVVGLNECRAHYVGNYIQVELHVEVDKNISTKNSHDIGKVVQRKIEKLSYIDKAFIHIDPM